MGCFDSPGAKPRLAGEASTAVPNPWRLSDQMVFPNFRISNGNIPKKNRIEKPVFGQLLSRPELNIELGANYELTTYVARHSFATRLKRKGASTDEISEYLGHASVETTKNYLDSFEDDLLKQRSLLLTDDI
jgi:integrase